MVKIYKSSDAKTLQTTDLNNIHFNTFDTGAGKYFFAHGAFVGHK